MVGRKQLGPWLLYGGCLAVALGMLGYYWLEYIPNQREYFLNLRFRALATVGDQFRTKIERLATSLDYATKYDDDPAEYISVLLPDLVYQQGCTANRPEQHSIEFGDGDTVTFYSGRKCPATATLSKIFARSVRDDLFDDILIAESGGRVVYQRGASSPRIVSLAELLKRPADAKNAPAEGGGVEADAVRLAQLDGSAYWLLLQPLRLSVSGSPGLVIAGLARSDRLADEARHVPPKYLLLIFAPLIVVLLSGPFLKILLLRRTGRLAFRDMVLLALFTVIAAGLGTILMLSWNDYEFAAKRSEPDLRQFATKLETQVLTDLRLMRTALEQYDNALPPGFAHLPESSRDRTDLLATSTPAGAPFVPFDFVFWTNADGCQVAKWTTKRLNTQRVLQTTQEHFRSITAGRLAVLDDLPDKPFALEALISPTTSQLIVVMAMPTAHPTPGIQGCGQDHASPLVLAAMVGPIPSLDSPLVPPAAGFAIFDSAGKVIFHSIPERNLHENLFEEMRAPAPWRAAVSMRAARSGTAYYRGRKYQFHMRPFLHLTGSSWNLAVFREMEPEQAIIGLVWGQTLIWFLATLCLIIAGFGLLSVIARARGMKWRSQAEFVLSRVWPHPARKGLYAELAAKLAVLSVGALSLLVMSGNDVLRRSGWLLPLCLIVPAGATVLIAIRLWREEPVSWSGPIAGQAQPMYVACLSLCVVLIGIFPPATLFRICQAFEARLNLMHWQQELLNQARARQSRVRAEREGSTSLSAKAKDFLRTNVAADGPDAQWTRPTYLSAFWNTKITAGASAAPSTGTQAAPPWWEELLASLRPEAQTDALEAGALARNDGSPGACRWEAVANGQTLLRCAGRRAGGIEISSTVPAAGAPAAPLWWLVALLLLGAAYAWYCLAFRRLFVLELRYNPLPPLSSLKPAEVDGHLLVLGLPLARKDGEVRKWLQYTPPRVNLYEERFHEFWLEETIARIGGEVRGRATRAAAVGGSTSSAAPAPAPWVHISNLEAKLRDPEDRRVVADLLERLFLMDVDGARVRLVATCAIDPIFHFNSVLYEERRKVFENPLTEPELQRFARLLHNFRKVQAPGPAATAPAWAASGAGAIVYAECAGHEALLAIGKDVASAAPPDSSREILLPLIAERARALYQMFWAICTRSEKLILVQLAQTGFVNPLCIDTLEVLMRKGLIVPAPQPRIMNETFREFLETVETRDTVREWEREAGESSWHMIRNVALVLVAVGLGVMALTQNQAMQTVTAVVTGVGTVLAGLFRLVGFLGGRRAAIDASTASPQ